uniref:Aminopeptidase n=1 Tax=Amphora coffeiformis TaxID=265554 RepID=A0A7S3P4T9_9STRA|mmetsp:Transcript_74/g.149  ORF Transcript_74/g.149 Transcript_74/m.149 type:complete len:892 (+) Transcript_74:110-2785(+)
MANKTAGRVLLPSHVVPEFYDLALEPDLEAFTFKGKVVISFAIDADKLDDEEVAKTITLHAKELTFISASYSIDDDPTVIPAEEIRVNLKATTVTFYFGTPLTTNASRVRLTIEYTGFLNDQMAGFYRSTYQDIEGKDRIMASTQFESLDARRAFPCVDEPAAKAVFILHLIIPSNRQALSNMPAASVVRLNANQTRISFMATPKMSTYLLAFLVGEFDAVSQLTPHTGVLVTVYTPPGKSTSGTFALQAACKSLEAYNDFFATPYPLPKLDLVAIPAFAAGAMENWGLVTFREVDLLIDPNTASNQQKQRVVTVVTHELAHQWFGNLVTMKWWNGLWLNEGFASWAENWAADLLFPEYKMWEQFTTGHLAAALRLDALKSSHPIEVPIHHAEEVEQVFDAISYCKGGSVARMIQNVLGMKAFRAGLQAYMKEFAYSNTETEDLWNAWEQATNGMPVGEIMASWTEQMGFPLLKVVKEEWSDVEVVLTLEQSWFLSDGAPLDDKGEEKLWTIPILTCTAEGEQEEMMLMREKTATVTIPAPEGGWVKLNAGQVVPMRVLPTAEMLEEYGSGIERKTMSDIDRAGLINDAYALVKAGHLSPESLIKLLGHYKDEDSYIVWEGLSGVLNGLDTVLSDNETMGASLQKFAKKLVLGLAKKVGWESSSSDGHLDTLLRGILISLLASFAYDDPSVAREANQRFTAFLENPKDVQSLPSDMRTSVFKIVLKNGGAKEYEQVKSYFYSADNNAERKHVLNSLGCVPDKKLKLATMDWCTSGEIKLQDFFYPMGSVGRSSREGREVSWTYYQENFGKIKSMLGKSNPSLMDACIIMCAGGFCSREKADEIEAFFEKNPLPSSTRKIAQTTESMRANAKFMDILEASPLSESSFWEQLP